MEVTGEKSEFVTISATDTSTITNAATVYIVPPATPLSFLTIDIKLEPHFFQEINDSRGFVWRYCEQCGKCELLRIKSLPFLSFKKNYEEVWRSISFCQPEKWWK